MVLEVNTLRDQLPEGAGLVADRRLLLDADRLRMVEENDVNGHFLLAAVGHVIPAVEVKRLGLSVGEDGCVVQLWNLPDTDVKELPKPEDKQRKKATTKARRKSPKKA